MAAKAGCCPTCGRKFATKRPAVDAGPVDLASLSTSELFAHYKRTALVEDVRFAIRIGADLPADLAIGWTALLADVQAGRVKGHEAYRQLYALQDELGRVRNALDLEERQRIAPIRRWAWMIKVPGAWTHYPMRAACAEFELPTTTVTAGAVMRIETRAVLAAAYLGPNKGRWTGHRMLTHSVEVDSTGAELRVLCGRVELGSIADVHADDPTKDPTCERCAAKLAAHRRRSVQP